MRSVAAWRVVPRRARAGPLLLGAAALTVILATVLLAAGPIYAAAVTTTGVRQTLLDAPAEQSGAQVATYTPPGAYPDDDAQVTGQLSSAFAASGATIFRSAQSESFALPGRPAQSRTPLAVVAWYDDIAAHATISAGEWPTADAGAGTVPVAVPVPAATALGLHVGDRLRLQSRRVATLVVEVVVTATYTVDDPTDGFWWGDPLALTGVQSSDSFTTYGPFVTTAEAFTTAQGDLPARTSWRAFPDLDTLTVGAVPALVDGVHGLAAGLAGPAGSSDARFEVSTSLDTLLSDTERSLLVTGSGVLIVTIQLAILAGYLLLLTATMLVERRRTETALLHARGAAPGQVVSWAVLEGLLLVVPAAILAPWLAATALRLFDLVGPLRGAGLRIHPVVVPAAYLLSAVAAVGCLLALTLPALAAARRHGPAATGRRPATRGFAQRAGLDLVLVVVAVLGCWQLARYRGAITATVQGSIGVDPFLVAAPALGLLAGAIIALRLVPLLARVADRFAARRRGAVVALGAWQLARRPVPYARASLLLIIAAAIGVFALSYQATWERSQGDQAAYQVGADVRVSPDVRVGESIPAIDLTQAQRTVPGVVSTMAVDRGQVSVSRTTGQAQLLAVDAAQAAAIVPFRSDLSAQPFPALMQELSTRRPTTPSIPIAGTPQSFTFDVALTPDRGSGNPPIESSLSVAVVDATGMIGELDAEPFPSDGRTHHLVFGLTYRTATGTVATPVYPLRLVSIELGLQGFGQRGRFELVAARTSTTPDGSGGTDLPLEPQDLIWQTTVTNSFDPPSAVTTQSPDGAVLTALVSTGTGPQTSVPLRLVPDGPRPAETIAAVVDTRLLDATQTTVGDTLQLDLAGKVRPVTITGVVDAFPTLDPAAPALVVDYPTLLALRYESGVQVQDSPQWWLTTAPGTSVRVGHALAAPPFSSPTVLTIDGVHATLVSDPVALGTIGAFALGLVAAALLAVIGFATGAAMTARERLTEFAVLRSIGLSTRRLARWLALEHGLLVGFGLAVGTALGVALAWFVLPLVSLTQAAAATVPPVTVVVPWSAVGALLAAVLVVLVATVAVLAGTLSRRGLGSSLRMGEE